MVATSDYIPWNRDMKLFVKIDIGPSISGWHRGDNGVYTTLYHLIVKRNMLLMYFDRERLQQRFSQFGDLGPWHASVQLCDFSVFIIYFSQTSFSIMLVTSEDVIDSSLNRVLYFEDRLVNKILYEFKKPCIIFCSRFPIWQDIYMLNSCRTSQKWF